VFLLTSFVLSMLAATYGYGQHLADLERPNNAVRLLGTSEVFAISAVALGKTSIALTLLVALATKRWQKIVIWTLVVFLNAVLWWIAISSARRCCQIEQQKVYRILRPVADSGGYPAWSAVIDFILAILPWFVIWHL
ncbi:hypothetical protein C8A03DRAFT_14945, partial [Achaetomium macrosporum]